VAVELGLGDREIGTLGLIGMLCSAGFCVLGGWLSDRFGRRRTLAVFIVATTIPVLILSVVMRNFGWVLPIDTTAVDRPVAPAELVTWFWVLVIGYSVAQGLMFGVGTAIFMDVTTPTVAATQFTAYMALCNVVYSYSATWQGRSIESWGYPVTLALDAAFGLISLLVLALMGKVERASRSGSTA
jgi:MFS family permease